MEKSDSDRPAKRQAVGSIKPLDIGGLEQQLWLVKIPSFVSEQWSKAKNDDILGSFMVGMLPGKDGKPPTKQLIVKLNEQLNQSSNETPQSFTLDDINGSGAQHTDSMIAFSTEPETEQFSVNGKVTKSLILRPQRTSDYSNLVRERSFQKFANRRESHTADFKALQKAAEQNQTVEFISSTKAELKAKAATKKSAGDGSGEELDLAALKSKVLEAFEKSERLKLKELEGYFKDVRGFTNSSVANLRELLDKYTKCHKKGMFRGYYELLPEYVSEKKPTSSVEASGSSSSASALS